MALTTKPADSTQAAVEQMRGRTRWLQETLRFYLAQVRDASKKTGGRATLVAALGADGPELEAVIGKVTPLQVGVIGRRTELVLIPSGHGRMRIVSPHEPQAGEI
ncbi:MAG: hypothetical protein NTX87_18305 [Planctomycetota bacterium]|nr:hypothetical protein [Planctomycetota bacterium]